MGAPTPWERARRAAAGLLQPPAQAPRPVAALAVAALLAGEAALSALVVLRVPYTKIDWDAYMQQVAAFRAGERDYAAIRGDTGPLVYPGGFLYAFAGIRAATGGDVFRGQLVFVGLYLATVAAALAIHWRAGRVPVWALGLLCLSKRIHSIYMLRLFNDGVATLLAHLAVLALMGSRWRLGLLVFSAAVSVKMNVLLMAPPLLLLLLKSGGARTAAEAIGVAAAFQLAVGAPFLAVAPWAYVRKSFELSRVFMWKWSVNLKFLPEAVFVSKPLAAALLALHLGLLGAFGRRRWRRLEGRGPMPNGREQRLAPAAVAEWLFVGNFIGVACARTLHFQFYSWYFFQLPFLLWSTDFQPVTKLVLWLSIEASFNATDERGEPKAQFALILTICHAALLVGLWFKEEEGGEREEEELAGGGRKSARLAAKRAKKAQKAA